MNRKKLPIGIQTFNKIRDAKENFVYIDKTDIALKLLEGSGYYFLSRPRRFGKSLFLSTLSEIFKGHKEYFEGLYIYDKWNWKESFPVILINLGSGNYNTSDSINMSIIRVLDRNCILLDIDRDKCYSENPGFYLGELIFQVYEKYHKKVVVLIDEYDKPILDNINNKDLSLSARGILRSFYSAIKDNDQYLRFVFLTGVSKFSKLNLFSGLNNLEDITIDDRYATITGYTHDDLKENFSDYTDGVDLEKVKKWYNGYNYFGEPVYNPFDILLFFSKGGKYKNYWWETGNPSFLIEILQQGKHYLPELENMVVSEEVLNAFDVDHIDIVALLWQTGYLTFDKKVDKQVRMFYKLKVPNLEIQMSLNALFFDYLTNLKNTSLQKQSNAVDAILNHDLESFKQLLYSLFAAIPYDNYVNNNISVYEGYYASVIYAFLSSLGFEVRTEDHTNFGRIDMTMIGPDGIFILEFKVDKPDESAIYQIENKKYYEKYLSENKKIYLIGIYFDSEKRNIVGFEWKVRR